MGGLATKRNVSLSLAANQDTSRSVPDTRMYSRPTLKTMLERYKMVYVKPNDGTGGRGVMRVEKLREVYKYQLLTTIRAFTSFDSMAFAIEKLTKSCPYVIQRGIHLLRHGGRSFDLRIMVQKNPKGEWETTGVIGRLGDPTKIVTNVCKGGTSKPAEVLLSGYAANISEYINRLRRLGYLAACQLNKTFPRIVELGLDVGIDRNLHPWILEANAQPAIYGFKTLKDDSIYLKMCRYQSFYGRGNHGNRGAKEQTTEVKKSRGINPSALPRKQIKAIFPSLWTS